MMINLYLCFSDAKLFVIVHIIILTIISLFDLVNSAFCMIIINVQYLVHVVMIPVYIILIFFVIEELKQWKSNVLSMYLMSFDVTTDFIVIYYFIYTNDYIF
eukprot:183386_1